MIKCIIVIGLIGYIASMKGCYNYMIGQVKAKAKVSAVVAGIFLIGMMVAWAFALAALLGVTANV